MEKLLPYFSFQGRANRQRYWLTSLAAYALFLIVAFVGIMIPFVGPVLGLVALVAFLWVVFATSTRRLHDRNKSAWWMLPMYLPLLLLSALAGIAETSDPMAGAGLSVLTLPFSIWILIDLGCLKGTTGPNRFGPDPLQPVSQVFA